MSFLSRLFSRKKTGFSSRRTILVFAREQASAQALIPLLAPLKKRYNVALYAKDFAVPVFEEAGFSPFPLKTVRAAIETSDPALILTGSSPRDGTEIKFWQWAEALELPSFALMDTWIGFKERFQGALPKKILLPDKIALGHATDAGLPLSRLAVTGQPFFHEIAERGTRADAPQRAQDVRRTLGVQEHEHLIIFFSEPIEAVLGINRYGYTEKTILAAYFEALREIGQPNIVTVIRLHPRENADPELPSPVGRVIVERALPSEELILASEIVCGMTSPALQEALLLGKPPVSIQIGLRRESPLALERAQILRSVRNSQELAQILKKYILYKAPSPSLEIIPAPIEKIMAEIATALT